MSFKSRIWGIQIFSRSGVHKIKDIEKTRFLGCKIEETSIELKLKLQAKKTEEIMDKEQY